MKRFLNEENGHLDSRKLLCEKIQRVAGRTSIRAWNPLLTFFGGALTSMSFNDFPFYKEMIGGSLKIY